MIGDIRLDRGAPQSGHVWAERLTSTWSGCRLASSVFAPRQVRFNAGPPASASTAALTTLTCGFHSLRRARQTLNVAVAGPSHTTAVSSSTMTRRSVVACSLSDPNAEQNRLVRAASSRTRSAARAPPCSAPPAGPRRTAGGAGTGATVATSASGAPSSPRGCRVTRLAIDLGDAQDPRWHRRRSGRHGPQQQPSQLGRLPERVPVRPVLLFVP